jgi:hypothetical protein
MVIGFCISLRFPFKVFVPITMWALPKEKEKEKNISSRRSSIEIPQK